MRKIFFSVVLAVIATGLACAQVVLPEEALSKLQRAVFEVVTKKSETDPISYDRELPLDRLPYAIRTDKYNPIGTAFLMDDGNFYTAAHVIDLTGKLLEDDFYIRDVEGKIYKIDKILSFATDRDFIVFTAKDFTPGKGAGLHASKDVSMNTQIFTVGNAQGEGIVIRDGMLTSRTPEDQNGNWKWLRFSAAASPGNSGGPLVDKNGDVLGIITMKNQTENLNYALPLDELKNIPENRGVVERPIYYSLPNIEGQRFFKQYSYEVTLPKSIEETRSEVWEGMKKCTAEHSGKLFDEYRFTGPKSILKTEKNSPILYSSFLPSFPLVLCLADNQKWGAYYPDDVKTYDLEDNGVVSYAEFLRLTMAYIEKPDSISERELISNPKLCMDYILKASPMKRAVGTEVVNVTSFGEPVESSRFTDCMDRQWLVNLWNVPWADVAVLSYSLPLPDGVFIMFMMDDVSDIYNGWNYDIPYLTDFVVPGYVGTFEQWEEYLALPGDVYPRHGILKGCSFDMNKKNIEYSFGKQKGSLPVKLLSPSLPGDDYLCLNYMFTPDEKQGLGQMINGVTFLTNRGGDDFRTLQIATMMEPPSGASKSSVDNYKRFKTGAYPYNGVPFTSEQSTRCVCVYDVQQGSLKILNMSVVGDNKNDEVRRFADGVKKALRVK